jgi:acetyl esterase/lipase
VAGVGACSPIDFLNRRVPDEAYRVTRDVPYGSLSRQRLDVYSPPAAEGPLPVVVFFYGGWWQAGEKADDRFVADALVSRGLVAVLPDYRIYPEARFPDFVEDGARAVAWTRENVAAYGGDPARIYLMGHSAGAHIAAMLTLDPHYLRALGLERSSIRGTIGLAGPYDFLPFHSDNVRILMGPPEGWPATQPINFVDGREPPMLLLHGGWDTSVGVDNTRRLAARIRSRGGEVEEIVYSRVGHQGVVGAMARPLRWVAPVLDDVQRFIAWH